MKGKSTKNKPELREQETQSKKALVSGQGTKKSQRTVALVGTVLVAAAAVVYVLFASPTTGSTREVRPDQDGYVRININDVADGRAHYFRMGKVRFFLLKSSEGTLRAALDACDVCYAAKKGYRQEGADMVCNNCDQRFPAERINEVKGGCNPVPLTRSVDGKYVALSAAELNQGAGYF